MIRCLRLRTNCLTCYHMHMHVWLYFHMHVVTCEAYAQISLYVHVTEVGSTCTTGLSTGCPGNHVGMLMALFSLASFVHVWECRFVAVILK